MLNRKTPWTASPRRWNGGLLNVGGVQIVSKEETKSIIIPGKLADESQIGSICTLIPTAVTSVSTKAPKPPKKRFLEAVAAHKLQQEMQYCNLNVNQEDNSALMQLAEMCVLYQKNGVDATGRSWSPAPACKVVDKKPPSISTTYSLINSGSSDASPKAGTPYWGWANDPLQHGEEENEEPLDLSGEHTIRTSQQDLIDHLVEKLCNRKQIDVPEQLKSITPSKMEVEECLPNILHTSSSEVTSTVSIDIEEVSPDIREARKDLPLKKRDRVSMTEISDLQTTICDSSTSTTKVRTTTEPVTSTNSKPAQRSCKGKRYLEFMYEGRIPLGNRVKRLERMNADVSNTPSGRKLKRRGKGKPGSVNVPNKSSSISIRGRKPRKPS